MLVLIKAKLTSCFKLHADLRVVSIVLSNLRKKANGIFFCQNDKIFFTCMHVKVNAYIISALLHPTWRLQRIRSTAHQHWLCTWTHLPQLCHCRRTERRMERRGLLRGHSQQRRTWLRRKRTHSHCREKRLSHLHFFSWSTFTVCTDVVGRWSGHTNQQNLQKHNGQRVWVLWNIEPRLYDLLWNYFDNNKKNNNNNNTF